MKLFVKIVEEYDNYNGLPDYQEVTCEKEPEISYSVCNLWECPEDAIIGRSLVSADEYLDILELGMKLGQKGYTKIEIE